MARSLLCSVLILSPDRLGRSVVLTSETRDFFDGGSGVIGCAREVVEVLDSRSVFVRGGVVAVAVRRSRILSNLRFVVARAGLVSGSMSMVLLS